MSESLDRALADDAALLAAKDERLVRQQEQIDRLLTATEGDRQVIDNLKAELNRQLRDAIADSPNQLLTIVRNAIQVDGVDAVFERVDDESFALRVDGATIRDGEIVAPSRRFLVEGTITAPVAFYVEAAGESEAEEMGDDILSDAAMSTEHALDMASPNDSQEFRAGIVEFALDDISED